MDIDYKRHILLKVLTNQRINLELKKAPNNVLGVSFDIICKELNCNRDYLNLVTSELFISEEIEYHDAGNIVGLFITEKGKTSFSNKKYYNRIKDRYKERVKFFVQITIPVLALIVAILSFSLKLENFRIELNNEIQELRENINNNND